LIIVLLFILSSCTIQKRLYNDGYNVDWIKRTDNNPKNPTNNSIRNDNSLKINSCSEVSNTNNNSSSQAVRSSFSSGLDINILTPEQNALSAPESISDLNSGIKKNYTYEGCKNIGESKNRIASTIQRKVERKIRKNFSDSNAESPISVLSILGYVFLLIGLITFLVLSMLVGAIVLVIGLLFVLFGINKNRSKNTAQNRGKLNDDNGELKEVVYMKNGGRIVGVIIERIPGVSIKIQTSDGNIFPVSENDIEKITKEIIK
jgi:hypothetical protein